MVGLEDSIRVWSLLSPKLIQTFSDNSTPWVIIIRAWCSSIMDSWQPAAEFLPLWSVIAGLYGPGEFENRKKSDHLFIWTLCCLIKKA